MAPHFENFPHLRALPTAKLEAKVIMNYTFLDHLGFFHLNVNSEKGFTLINRHNCYPTLEEYAIIVTGLLLIL